MIERAAAADIDDLVELMTAYCNFYGTRPSHDALGALVGALLSRPSDDGVQLVARHSDGQALGFATIYWSWSTIQARRIAVMNDLYVRPSARGAGLAAALIASSVAEATRHGASRLEWQTRPDNLRAQRVYERAGAECSEWLTYQLPLGQSPRFDIEHQSK